MLENWKKHHQQIQGKKILMKHMNFLLKMKADLRAQQVAEIMKKSIDSFAYDVTNFHHFMLLDVTEKPMAFYWLKDV